MSATLTDDQREHALAARLSIVLTRCNLALRKMYEKELPPLLCDKFQLCDITIFCYDDYHSVSESMNGVGKDASWWSKIQIGVQSLMKVKTNDASPWRSNFQTWVQYLPDSPLPVPSESKREQLKREHEEAIQKAENEKADLRHKIKEAEQKAKSMEAEGSQMGKHMEELRREISNLNAKLTHYEQRSCFSPMSTVVHRERGQVKIKDLTVGTEVATANGWAKVITMLHWHPTQRVASIDVFHEDNVLHVSSDHMVFAMDDEGSIKAIPAKDLQVGSMLVQKKGEAGKHLTSRVESVYPATMDGYYAPLTSDGTILVDGILASCYVHHEKYEFSHWALNVLAAPLRWVPSWLMSYVTPAGHLHPYVDVPLKMLNHVVQ